MRRPGILEKIYLYFHHRKFKRRSENSRRFNDRYIVSVGNLSAGGTGKTPAVIELASRISDLNPLIVLRGYGGRASSSGALVSDGKKILASYEDVGDEAILIARKARSRVAIMKDRSSAIESFGLPGSPVILDDAFQNPSVFRNHDLVLIDCTVDPDRVKVFPAGSFREDWSALSRADSILLTRTDLVDDGRIDKILSVINRVAPGIPVFRSIHRPIIKGEHPGQFDAGAFCGIGNPESFRNTLTNFGIHPVAFRKFRDHQPFTKKNIASIFQDNDLIWYTTEKDKIRIDALDIKAEWLDRLRLVEIQLEIVGADKEDFFSVIFNGLSL